MFSGLQVNVSVVGKEAVLSCSSPDFDRFAHVAYQGKPESGAACRAELKHSKWAKDSPALSEPSYRRRGKIRDKQNSLICKGSEWGHFKKLTAVIVIVS